MRPYLNIQRLQSNPAALGLSISAALLVGLLLHEIILGRFTVIFGEGDVLQDFETAVISILLSGYLVGAYYAVQRSTRNTIDELKRTWEPTSDASTMGFEEGMGKRLFFAMGLVGVLLATLMTHLLVEAPWDWSTWGPETWWHRLLGLFIGWWFTWFATAIADSSESISRLSARIGSVDLLDHSPWFPSVRHGLLTAMLTIGAVSIGILYLVDPKLWLAVAIVLGVCLPLALVTSLLPVRGVNQLISTAKQSEIAWTRNRIRQFRSLMEKPSSDVAPGQMADLTAYLELIKEVPEWPFQTSTMARLLFYLLIPVASWAGKQMIQTALDQLFR
ncbi:MAG: hypothetical protein DWQ07_16475 [Chloroflexi bacterium]|nr:MAG: hypothetical protein DWQ07_16475 [Chloroflexota bacterium]MBL1195349.1 hypothetical protein [Chloroflexota bacterium]NOH12633.1 hypothetical protein [Chloroflexota bacterium]